MIDWVILNIKMKTSRIEKFLINRGLLEAFNHNLRHYSIFSSIKNYKKRTGDAETLILTAFSWDQSSQGREFWSDLEKEWWECLDNNTL